MSLALYRRYRPETYEEVIGQDHVTQPLQRALSNQRVNHAYLFSGPRGCGKTTSARILARCLNCEQGPTPTPCGICKSCMDLARGGPGSIDVIEIDAASHGGVDDARDLRERAFFAPVSSRYKVYILDEAHMVSQAGFNALLKVVEEPPPHLKFIFATTEPEKVIGTIRSRTHHYPFRLVPPGVLRDYLALVCERESVQVNPDVLPLVVRAGAGSVRDSMSVLDQLLAGAGEDGVTYQMAVGLLGYTDATLLDEAVSAFAARDGAAAFQAVDHVVEGGHDPRRFLADLLERLRDLLILAAVPDAADKGLITAPGDQLARMREQAGAFGPSELSRAADLVNAGLLEMRGATAPRLLLELICARVLLPSADDPVRGVAARLDRLERGGVFSAVNELPAGGTRPSGLHAERQRGGAAEPAGPSMAAATAPHGVPAAVTAGAVDLGNAAAAGQVPTVQGQQAAETAEDAFTPPWRKNGVGRSGSGGTGGAGAAAPQGAATQSPASQGPASQGAMTPSQAPQSAASGGGMTESASVRQLWPQVLEAVARRSKVAWVMLQTVHVVGVEGRLLQLGFSNPGLRDNFHGSNREETLRDALRELTGTDWKIDALVDPSAGTGSPASLPSASIPPPMAPPTSAAAPVAPSSAAPPSQAAGANPNQAGQGSSAPAAAPPAFAQPAAVPEDEPDPDDEDVDDAGPTARDLLVRELGATVLEEKSDAD